MYSKHIGLSILLIGVFVVKDSHCVTPEQEVEIDKLVQDVFMTRNAIPGVGLTIVENSGNTSFAKGYGYSNLERNITANNNTKFCIASITKTFTATIIIKVLSETFPELGPTVLETPLRILHPNGNFTFSDRFRYESMSFRDLLSHRHGLRTESWGSSAGAFKDIEEFTFRSRYAPEVAPFRAGWFYSNTLFALAGKLIAEIAQQPYHTLLQNFFDQLGMNESILITEDANLELVANMSRGYFLRDGVVTQLNSSLLNRVFVGAPAGAIISTSSDMSKYISFHLNNGRVGNQQIISEKIHSSVEFGAVSSLNHLVAKQSSPLNISQESFVGVFENPVEGELEISLPNGTLYFRFGTWATGYLIKYPNITNTYTVSWDSDFVQDIYFIAGGFQDMFMHFENNDTLRIIFDDEYIFRRGVTLDTLPMIPWAPNTCGSA